MQARELRGANARETILARARELFTSDGYEGFSMRKLAQAVGCAPGTIYLHFQNQAELFDCMVGQSFGRLQQSLCGLRDRHAQGDPVVLLKKALHTYIEFGLRNPNDYRFAFLPRRAEDESDNVDAVLRIIGSIIGRCVGEGAFRPGTDIECTTQAVWASIHGITSILIQKPGFPWVGRGKLIEQVVANAVDNLIAGTADHKSAAVA
jgi:AcrR family transcriptional regulator